ncbi:MAG: adenylosuccinate synthase, partial [Gemmatimonadetes bacterium]|nr:adenylosuccinate synthase [Gemmatimonadota bacterium]
MRCLVVVGAQWGDEGKGKIVDALAGEADWIARYQGGANAGHTVWVGDAEFILHQIPSGILHPGKRCAIGNGVVLDPSAFFEELAELERRGVPDVRARILVSERAHVVLPYHKMIDKALEQQRGNAQLGTTRRGIGPAYEDKAARVGLRVADLREPEEMRKVLERGAARADRILEAAGSPERVDLDRLVKDLERIREELLAMSVDVGAALHDAIAGGQNVLLEGAQGSMLDIDHGTYPYVTSSNSTAGGAAVGVGIGPTAIAAVLGVVKAYATRVGGGPFPTEIPGPVGDRLREAGSEYGATTGRPRRAGWFDAEVVRYAARVNGLTALAVTKLDVLDAFDEVKIAVGYRWKGRRLDRFPADVRTLEDVEPITQSLPGWRRPTGEARRLDDLPPQARRYLDRIEELTGLPIRYVSVGTRRAELIRVGDPAFA